MSETQYYKTVTFKSRIAITVESALMDYIMSNAKMAGQAWIDAETVRLLTENVQRAEEALVAIRAGALSEGLKT